MMGKTPRRLGLIEKTHPVLRWLLVLASLIVIGYLSSQTFKEQDLRPQIQQHENIVSAVRALPSVSFEYNRGVQTDNRSNPVSFIHFFIRKSAHLILYSVLGLATLWALGGIVRLPRYRLILAISLVAVVAVLDELNQAFSAGRTGMARDVIIDVSGFLVIVMVASFLRRTKRRGASA